MPMLFKSPYEHCGDKKCSAFNGRYCDLWAAIDPAKMDIFETGPLYKVRFDDGTLLDAWPEELHQV